MPDSPKRQCPLWLMLVVGLVAIGLQIPKSLPYTGVGFALVIILFALTEPETLRMIGNWRFWLMGLVIAGLSGLLLGKKFTYYYGIPVSIDGLTTGIIIVARASIFVTLLMALSKRLNADIMIRWFAKMGVPQAGGAFAFGIQLLPRMVSGWKHSFKKRKTSGFTDRMARLIKTATDLSSEIARDMDLWLKPRKAATIFTITGPPGSGKTSFLKALNQKIEDTGLSVGGFIQPGLHENDTRIGYDVELLHNNERLVLARKSDDEHEPWEFESDTFLNVYKQLETLEEKDAFIIDEIGRIERHGEGHWPTLAGQLPMRGGVWIVSVRQGLADSTCSRLGCNAEASLSLPATEKEIEAFSDAAIEAVVAHKTKLSDKAN